MGRTNLLVADRGDPREDAVQEAEGDDVLDPVDQQQRLSGSRIVCVENVCHANIRDGSQSDARQTKANKKYRPRHKLFCGGTEEGEACGYCH